MKKVSQVMKTQLGPHKKDQKGAVFLSPGEVVCKDYLPKIDMPPKQVTI